MTDVDADIRLLSEVRVDDEASRLEVASVAVLLGIPRETVSFQ